MALKTEGQVLEQIRGKLGHEPDPRIWGYLIEKGCITGATGDEPAYELRDVVDEYRGCARFFSEEWITTQTDAAGKHLNLVSRMAAEEATSRPDVTGFRAAHLGGRLLSRAKVPDWIDQAVVSDGPPDYVEAPDPTTLKLGESWSSPTKMLAYGSPDKPAVMRKYVRGGGVLDALRQISENLESTYGWQPAQATVFVLTGGTPEIPQARTSVTYSATREGEVTARVHLDLDASLSPAAVSRLYQNARMSLAVPAARLRRPMVSPKHVALAEFMEEHAGDGRTWKEKMQEWNSKRPDPKWKYEGYPNFARDATKAQRRIYGEQPRTKKGRAK